MNEISWCDSQHQSRIIIAIPTAHFDALSREQQTANGLPQDPLAIF